MPLTILDHVNWFRLWVLVTSLWLAGVVLLLAEPVSMGYHESLQVKRELDRSIRESKYQACLSQHGIVWLELFEKHKPECYQYAVETCGNAVFCDSEYWREFCIKTKPGPCQDIGTLVEGDDSPHIHPSLSFAQDSRAKQLLFYWHSGFSQPFVFALLVALLPPLLLAVAPAVLRRLASWLLTKPSP